MNLIQGYWRTTAGRYIPSFTAPTLIHRLYRWAVFNERWEDA
jgi:hypothetical protein